MRNIYVSAYTDAGDKRMENQDSILYKCGTFGRHKVGLFVVADGCGGLAHGAEVSALITCMFSKVWAELFPELMVQKKISEAEIFGLIESQLHVINEKALEFSKSKKEKCGSTVSLLLIIDKQYYIFNVGDSRVYHIRRKITRLTEDHTVVADMLRNHEITAEEAKTHRKRHMLSMCIGYFNSLRIFKIQGRLKKKDIFLLCCDGLYNFADQSALIKIAKEKDGFESCAKKMRESIPAGKARDNVSVIVVKYE